MLFSYYNPEYLASIVNPGTQILESLLAHLPSNLHPLRVVWIKEVVFRFVVALHLTAVLAEVKHPGVDPKPLQVARQLLADVGLAPGREAHHGNDVGGGGGAGGDPRGPLGEGEVVVGRSGQLAAILDTHTAPPLDWRLVSQRPVIYKTNSWRRIFKIFKKSTKK